jgi:hypothetical protein
MVDLPLGMLGSVVLMVEGHSRMLSRLGVNLEYVSVELTVVVYAVLRFAYSGYGVNTQVVSTLSQSSGWKYPTPYLPASAVFVSSVHRR